MGLLLEPSPSYAPGLTCHLKLKFSAQASVFSIIEGLRAKRAYIGFLGDFHFLQDRANFRRTELF